MHLFTMLQFQDLFIGQIIGMLVHQKYVGMVNFLSKNDAVATSIWINANGVTHIQRDATKGKEPLLAIFWHTHGKIGLYPKVSPHSSPPINFAEIIDAAMATIPPLPISCPMLEHVYLNRGTLKPEKQNSLDMNSRDLLRRISADGIEMAKLRKIAAWTNFWSQLLYLCSDGQIICNYEQTLGRLLKKFENNLISRLTSLFGARALVPFNTEVQEILQNTWPDWTTGNLPDPLYGTAPYHLWIKTLKEKIPVVGIPTLANRSFDQVLEKLEKPDADLIRYLLQ